MMKTLNFFDSQPLRFFSSLLWVTCFVSCGTQELTPADLNQAGQTRLALCGDGVCDINGGENMLNCLLDCPPAGDGGNGGSGDPCNYNMICESGEDMANCPSDCNPFSGGDGGIGDPCNYNMICESGEDNANCPSDCNPFSGDDGGIGDPCNYNLVCEPGEDVANCPNDCFFVDGGNPPLDSGIFGSDGGAGDDGGFVVPTVDAGVSDGGDGDGDGDAGIDLDAGIGDGDGDGDGDAGIDLDAGVGDGDGDGDGDAGDGDGDGDGDGGGMLTDGGCDMCSPEGDLRCKNDRSATMICVDGCWEYTECADDEVCTNTTGGDSCTEDPDDGPGESVQCQAMDEIGEPCEGMVGNFRCSESTVERCTSLGDMGAFWLEVAQCDSPFQCQYAASSDGDGCCRDICVEDNCTCTAINVPPIDITPSLEIPMSSVNCPPPLGGKADAKFILSGKVSGQAMNCANDCKAEFASEIEGDIEVELCKNVKVNTKFMVGGSKKQSSCTVCNNEGDEVSAEDCTETCDSTGMCEKDSFSAQVTVGISKFYGTRVGSGKVAGVSFEAVAGATVSGEMSAAYNETDTQNIGLSDECLSSLDDGCDDCREKSGTFNLQAGASAGAHFRLSKGSWNLCIGKPDIAAINVSLGIGTEEGTCPYYDCRTALAGAGASFNSGCLGIPFSFLRRYGVILRARSVANVGRVLMIVQAHRFPPAVMQTTITGGQ